MQDRTSVKFIWVMILNFIITIAEFLGGIFSGSLALLSDALHNLGDTGAIVLSFFAHLISKKNKDQIKTFGYERAETLAAFTNGVALVIISFFLIIEAIGRFFKPEPIKGNIMLVVAIIGLIANIISMAAMHNDSKDNLNVKSTFIHMLSDALSSIVVVIGAIFIKIWHWEWLDPTLTILVSIFILYEAFKIIKNAADVLMESNPSIDLDQVKEIMLTVPEITNVHHVHLWKYSDQLTMLDAHVNVQSNLETAELETIYNKLEQKLSSLGINHITLQAECTRGLKEDMIENNKND
ncbi:cation diffusion facilitator family transporter [Lactobacillus rodentium]|uniref:Cation transporter n=1 Tax=Lactobacillus rodentium TaxID=947835 RepID=A0A2Z6TE42_9LACO|nr:cation diffusion facilitator family transporter [Lactobacillus rodentium]MCR1893892.1 cation diffusion facilitator family transporter [Lactobacillus rodentium]GBG04242.1 cation transporter [Lactobacillus rodentium]